MDSSKYCASPMVDRAEASCVFRRVSAAVMVAVAAVWAWAAMAGPAEAPEPAPPGPPPPPPMPMPMPPPPPGRAAFIDDIAPKTADSIGSLICGANDMVGGQEVDGAVAPLGDTAAMHTS